MFAKFYELNTINYVEKCVSLFENVFGLQVAIVDLLFWVIKLRRVPPLLAKIVYGHARSSGGRLTR